MRVRETEYVPVETEARDDGRAAERDRDKVQQGKGALVQLVAGVLNRRDVRRVRDVEVVRVGGERTGGQGGDEAGDVSLRVQAGREAIEDGGEVKDLEVVGGEVGDVLVEQVVEHGHADHLADGADDDRQRDGGSDELVGADDGEHDLTGEQNPPDADETDDQRCPCRVDILGVDGGHGAEAWHGVSSGRDFLGGASTHRPSG